MPRLQKIGQSEVMKATEAAFVFGAIDLQRGRRPPFPTVSKRGAGHG
jgi:hypothetical protein